MAISTYSSTPGNNTALFPENMTPSALNDGMRQVQADIRSWFEDSQWTNLGDTPSRASSSTFKITGDVTTKYEVNRKIKLYDATTIYGLITASAYSAPDTLITVDNTSLTASLSSVALGIITATNNAIPGNFSTSTLTVTGAATISGAAVMKTTLTAESTATISGQAVCKTGLTVEGVATISGTAIFKTTPVIEGNATQAGRIRITEDTDNGSNYVELAAPSSIASNLILTLPSALGALTSNLLNFSSAGVASFIGAGWEFIQSQTASSSAALDFTGLTSAYPVYVFVHSAILPATDNVQYCMRVSDDNGATYLSGASDYRYINAHCSDDQDGVFYGRSTGRSLGEIIMEIGNTTGDELHAVSFLFGAGVSIRPQLLSYVTYRHYQNDAQSVAISSIRRLATTTNAIRFLFSSNNIASGTVYQFGVRI